MISTYESLLRGLSDPEEIEALVEEHEFDLGNLNERHTEAQNNLAETHRTQISELTMRHQRQGEQYELINTMASMGLQSDMPEGDYEHRLSLTPPDRSDQNNNG